MRRAFWNDRRSVRFFRHNKRSAVNRKFKPFFDFRRNIYVLDSQKRAADATVFFNVFQIAFDGINRQGETDVLSAENYRHVYADDLAFHIN